MNKNFKYYVAVWAVMFVLYNVVVFAIRPVAGFAINYDARFFITWIAVVATFVGQLYCANLAFKSENIEKLFLNIPLITQSYTALILMAVASAVLLMIPDCPVWVSAIVCVVILAFSIMGVLKAKAAAKIVSDIGQKLKEQTYFIKSLTVDAQNLLNRVPSDSAKTELKKVYEILRYSDPMSAEQLAEIETKISEEFSVISQKVHEENLEDISIEVEKFVNLVKERNSKCKLLK